MIGLLNNRFEMILILFFIFQLNFLNCFGSVGDASPFYRKCVENCGSQNCTADGLKFKTDYSQPLADKLLLWTCKDECSYECMWKTVNSFKSRNWKIPQFYGKWPFVKFMGLQEPASVLFSLLNLYLHIKMLKKFRSQVRKDSPMYSVWLLFAYTSINAWIWSAAFHARDFPLTEIMDYICAFSMVLVFCYCMAIRLLRSTPRYIQIAVSLAFLILLLNHAVYLSSGRFDYGYNMQLNILIGSSSALIWFLWSLFNRKRQPYVMKCAVFVTIAASSTLLEVLDFPPVFYVFDAHSLWHLSSAPITPLLYSFIIDDCKYLRNMEEDKIEKKIV